MEFEWGEAKRLSNLAKHLIDFRDAVRLFAGPHTIQRSDRYSEERWIATGLVDGRLVAVVFTYRGHRVRLISARPAGRRERQAYRQIYPGGG
jgi:hypothetical protein